MTATATRPGRHAVRFLFITVLLDMIGFGLVMPVMPSLINEISGLDAGRAAIYSGWLLFSYSALQFLMGPVLGNLSDAWGRRPVLLLSILGLAVDYTLTALAPTLLWLFVGRAIAGLCGASYTTANACLSDFTPPEERAKAFGLMGAAFGLGFVIGPAAGGLLGEYGVRIPFYAAALLAAVNFCYGWFFLPETLPPGLRRPFAWSRSNPLGALKVFRSYPRVIPLLIVDSLYFFTTSIYPAVWAFWCVARFGWSEFTIGLTLATYGLVTAMVQGWLTGPTVKWMGERNAVLVALITAAVTLAAFGIAPGLIAVLALSVINAAEGFLHPALTAMMSREAPPDAQGELQGGIASAQNLAMLGGTLFFAYVFGYLMGPDAPFRSADISFFIAAGLLALGAIYFPLAVKQEKPAVTQP